MYPFPPPPTMLQRTIAWWRGDPLNLEFVSKALTLCEALPKRPAEIGGGAIWNEMSGTRNSSIAWVPFPGEEGADSAWLYQMLAGLLIKVNEDLFKFFIWGFIDRLQYTVYEAEKGEQHYGRHVDIGGPGVPQRKLSFSILLDDPMTFDGGDLKIYGVQPTIVPKELGSVFVFPSYTEHEVTPVTRGRRRSLVGWVSGWDFR